MSVDECRKRLKYYAGSLVIGPAKCRKLMTSLFSENTRYIEEETGRQFILKGGRWISLSEPPQSLLDFIVLIIIASSLLWTLTHFNFITLREFVAAVLTFVLGISSQRVVKSIRRFFRG